MFALMISWTSQKAGLIDLKTRSVGLILEKSFVCPCGHIVSPVPSNTGLNVVLMIFRTIVETDHVEAKLGHKVKS